MFYRWSFRKKYVYNGGFEKGSRTSDNIFILNGLVQGQLSEAHYNNNNKKMIIIITIVFIAGFHNMYKDMYIDMDPI